MIALRIDCFTHSQSEYRYFLLALVATILVDWHIFLQIQSWIITAFAREGKASGSLVRGDMLAAQELARSHRPAPGPRSYISPRRHLCAKTRRHQSSPGRPHARAPGFAVS